MSFHYFGVYKHAIHKVIKSIASLTSIWDLACNGLKHCNEQHGYHAWNDAIINQSYIAYLRAGLPSSCCKGEACLPRSHCKGEASSPKWCIDG